jgi:hypothetical protein
MQIELLSQELKGSNGLPQNLLQYSAVLEEGGALLQIVVLLHEKVKN